MTFDEWFHKEYEPADLQIKQYAERKEGLHIPATVYIDDLKKAFEAGQKGKVVEHFEAYGQCRDSRRIAELEKENAELTDELTLTNNECKEMREELKQRIRENQELCEQIEKMKCCENCGWYYLQQHWRESKEINESRMFHCGTCGNKRNWKIKEIKE